MRERKLEKEMERVSERNRKRERVCVCERERERVCVCVRKRESERKWNGWQKIMNNIIGEGF